MYKNYNIINKISIFVLFFVINFIITHLNCFKIFYNFFSTVFVGLFKRNISIEKWKYLYKLYYLVY